MPCRVQKRVSLRRRLHILQDLTNSNNIDVKHSNFSSNILLLLLLLITFVNIFTGLFLKANINRNSIANSTFLQVQKLKLELENLQREYENLVATRRYYISLLNANVNNTRVCFSSSSFS